MSFAMRTSLPVATEPAKPHHADAAPAAQEQATSLSAGQQIHLPRRPSLIAVLLGLLAGACLASLATGYLQTSAPLAPAAAQPGPAPIAAPVADLSATEARQLAPPVPPTQPERSVPQAAGKRRAADQAAPAPLQRSPAASDSDPIALAYAAFGRGDYASADRYYRQVLALQPDDRDAEQGLAALAARIGHSDDARQRYAALHQAQPQEPATELAFHSLQAADADGRSEARLRELAAHGGSAASWTALGRLLASQSRWREAQQAYFAAHAAAPGLADTSYNLAISLDALGEAAQARHYYRQALQLAEGQASGFAGTAVKARLSVLEAP